MFALQLTKLAKSDPITKPLYLGTFASDKLPTPTNYPFCFIANTHPSNKEGEHWVALFCDSNKNCEYFDSYGRSPIPKITTYINSYCESLIYNRTRIQGILAATCGHYCLYYCLMWARGYNLFDITDRFNKDTPSENDILITEFINEVFGCSLSPYDTDFLKSQLISIIKDLQQ